MKNDFNYPADFDSNFGWNTTANDGQFELAGALDENGNIKDYVSPGGKINIDGQYFEKGSDTTVYGKQFAELCATDQSSLYQTISTTPGAVLTWGLKHRARRAAKDIIMKDNKNYNLFGGKDTMALFIGKAQKTDLKKPALGVNFVGMENTASSNNDIFIWMAELLKQSDKVNISFNADEKTITNNETPGTIKEFTVYSKEDVDAKEVNLENYTNYFSMTPNTGKQITKEWKCWIITDDASKWGDYAGKYAVEEGQTETTFAFTALTGIRTWNNNDSEKRNCINEGNLLDDVQFTAEYPLTVGVTGSGEGTVTSDDTETVNVNPNNQHKENYTDGTGITITAKASSENSSFVGAVIDGKMYTADSDKFNKSDDGTYTFTDIMNRPKVIRLIFAKSSTVTYDPNGGAYRGSPENTEIHLAAEAGSVESEENSNDVTIKYDKHENSDDAWPNTGSENDIKFIGWYFARGNNGQGALISSKHTVTYVKDGNDKDMLEVEYIPYDDNGNECEKQTAYVEADSGVTFIARYKYKQSVIVAVKGTNDINYDIAYTGHSNVGSIDIDVTAITKYSKGSVSLMDEETGDDYAKYGRIGDLVTVKANTSPSGSYIFMGWYTKMNGGELLSDATVYSYAIDDITEIYARYSEALQYPYLSFVAQDNDKVKNIEDSNFNIGSHIKVGPNIVSKADGTGNSADGHNGISEGHYGGNKYGNTISTGFVSNMSHTEASGLVDQYCTWVIKIPKDSYIKITDDGNVRKDIKLSESAVLDDSDGDIENVENTYYNKGKIYKIEDITSDNENNCLTLKYYDKLPAAVSGGMTVTYGIIIDNLYAPGATATLTYHEKEEGAIDLTNSENGAVISASFEDYAANSPYKK